MSYSLALLLLSLYFPLSTFLSFLPPSLQAVSPNKRYAAVADKGEKPTVTVFDLHTLRKRKVLSFSELQAHEYVSVAFSPDSKYLIAQGGGPDWTLVYWGWEKAKLMATLKTTNQNNSPVHQVRGRVVCHLVDMRGKGRGMGEFAACMHYLV